MPSMFYIESNGNDLEAMRKAFTIAATEANHSDSDIILLLPELDQVLRAGMLRKFLGVDKAQSLRKGLNVSLEGVNLTLQSDRTLKKIDTVDYVILCFWPVESTLKVLDDQMYEALILVPWLMGQDKEWALEHKAKYVQP